jgi:hypothetical protein
LTSFTGTPLSANDCLWEKRFARVATRAKEGKGFIAGTDTKSGPWMAEQRKLGNRPTKSDCSAS